jgi:hypothetical protein
MDRVKHDDATDDDSTKQGFDLLFGGSLDLDATAWDNEEELDQEVKRLVFPASDEPSYTAVKINLDTVQAVHSMDLMMARVHSCTPEVCDGRFLEPPVRVVNLPDQNNRGNSLVATKSINKGQVIFTERAAFGTQLPSLSGSLAKRSAWTCGTYSIRACQHCFRSLEPISSVSDIRNDSNNPPLPLPHLWPVPEYNQDDDQTNEDGLYRMDSHGRVQCTECFSLFCNYFCRKSHCQEFKSCCDCLRAVTSNADEDMQPAVILACRIFANLLHKYRQGLVNEEDSLLMSSQLNNLCGDAGDIQQLELGKVCQDRADSYFTLQTTYGKIADGLHITSDERNKLNLQLLEQIASIVARNSFDIATQSPFSEYHGALLRAAGGRGTEHHVELMKQVAKALGSPDGTLQRGMDKHVEEKVCFVRWMWHHAVRSGLAVLINSCLLGSFSALLLLYVSSPSLLESITLVIRTPKFDHENMPIVTSIWWPNVRLNPARKSPLAIFGSRPSRPSDYACWNPSISLCATVRNVLSFGEWSE